MRRKSNEPYEFAALADYNAEVARGLVHTPEWQAKMAAEQQRFNAQVYCETKPLTGLTVESGYAPSIYPDRIVFGDYFKSYGEVVHELTEANKRIAAMREDLHQSLHPQTTDGTCRYCEKEEM